MMTRGIINKGKGRRNQTYHLTKKKDIYVKVQSMRKLMYTDQMEKFLIRSSTGNQYIMTWFEIDGNVILLDQ